MDPNYYHVYHDSNAAVLSPPRVSLSPRLAPSSTVVDSRISALFDTLKQFGYDVRDAFKPLIEASRDVGASVDGRTSLRSIGDRDLATNEVVSRQYSIASSFGTELGGSWDIEADSGDLDSSTKEPDALYELQQQTSQSLHRDLLITSKGDAQASARALNLFVPKVERHLSVLLTKISSSIQIAAVGLETLKTKWRETERKTLHQNDHIEELEAQLAEFREAVESQARLHRVVDQLEKQNEALRESLKSSSLRRDISSHRQFISTSHSEQNEISELQAEVRELKRLLEESERERDARETERENLNTEIGENSNTDSFVGRTLSKKNLQKTEELLDEHSSSGLPSAKGDIPPDNLIKDELSYSWCTRTNSKQVEPLILEPQTSLPVQACESQTLAVLGQSEELVNLQAAVNELNQNVTVLKEERDAIANFANQRLSMFESDVKAFVSAEVDHIRQRLPTIVILENLSTELSTKSNGLLNEAILHIKEEEIQRVPNTQEVPMVSREHSIFTESDMTTSRKPRRLYRYRLQNYLPGNE